MTEFYYKTKNDEIFLYIYRHILYISITAPLDEELLKDVMDNAVKAQNILNNKFRFWGTVYCITSNFSIEDKIFDQIKAAINEPGAKNRKALAVVCDNNRLLSTNLYSALESLPSDTEYRLFKIVPEALDWIDDVLNTYVSRMFARQ